MAGRIVIAVLAAALGFSAAGAQPAQMATAGTAQDFETTVYFDYGQQRLGSAGILLVQEMAVRARDAGLTKVKVVGHTDKAGTAEQNLRDGRARAEAVAAVLYAQGFAPEDVVIDSAGETMPARKHDDERSEPLNRRAVLYFHD